MMTFKKFTYTKRFQLENGQSLPGIEIAYQTFGKLNKEQNNVIWACHALTANSNVFDWWKGLFGEKEVFNPEDHFIICANNLGSCYGTTGPLSINSDTKGAWFDYFPHITIKDIVAGFELLRQYLKIEKINTIIGGSQGGQIALEWAISNDDLFEHLILIATNAQHSPWGIAFNESQRLAIKADRTYYSNIVNAAQKGLSAARSIALLSYRGYDTYNNTQKDENSDKTTDYCAASYQRYQGEKLVSRFNAYSYVRLLEAMDSHNIARNRATTFEQVLAYIQAKTLVIGISTDILFPTHEQKFIAKNISDACYSEIDSEFGHDGFLIETERISKIISEFYKKPT